MISRNLLNPITAHKRKAAVKSCTDDHLDKSSQARPKRVVQSSILDEIHKRYPQTVRVRQVPNFKDDRLATYSFPTEHEDLKAHFTQTPTTNPKQNPFNVTDSFRYKSEDIALDFTTAALSASKARRKSDASGYNGGLSSLEKKIGCLNHESVSKRFKSPVRPKSVVKVAPKIGKFAKSCTKVKNALRMASLFKKPTKTEPEEKEEKPKAAVIQIKKEVVKEQSRSLTSIDQNVKNSSIGRLDTSEDLIALAETLNANDSLIDRVQRAKTERDEGRGKDSSRDEKSEISNRSKSKSKLNGSKLKKRSSATPSYKDISEFKNKPVIKISNMYYKPVVQEAKTERPKKTPIEFNRSPSAIENNFDQIMREFKGNEHTNKENNYSEQGERILGSVVGSLAYLNTENTGYLPVIEEEERVDKKRRYKSTGKDRKLSKHKNTLSMNFMPVYAAKKTVLPALRSASKERSDEKEKSAKKKINNTPNATEMPLREKNAGSLTSLHNLMLTDEEYEPAFKEDRKKNMLLGRELIKQRSNKMQVMSPSPRMFTGSGFSVGTSAF